MCGEEFFFETRRNRRACRAPPGGGDGVAFQLQLAQQPRPARRSRGWSACERGMDAGGCRGPAVAGCGQLRARCAHHGAWRIQIRLCLYARQILLHASPELPYLRIQGDIQREIRLAKPWRGTSSLLWEQLTQSRRGSPRPDSAQTPARQNPREAWEYLAQAKPLYYSAQGPQQIGENLLCKSEFCGLSASVARRSSRD